MPSGESQEFDCVDCGDHVVRIGPCPMNIQLCALCLHMPGWIDNPELVQIFRPNSLISSGRDGVPENGEPELANTKQE